LDIALHTDHFCVTAGRVAIAAVRICRGWVSTKFISVCCICY